MSYEGEKIKATLRRSKRLGYDGRHVYIGVFPTEEKAARAVDAYIYAHCPKMASKANFPRDG